MFCIDFAQTCQLAILANPPQIVECNIQYLNIKQNLNHMHLYIYYTFTLVIIISWVKARSLEAKVWISNLRKCLLLQVA